MKYDAIYIRKWHLMALLWDMIVGFWKWNFVTLLWVIMFSKGLWHLVSFNNEILTTINLVCLSICISLSMCQYIKMLTWVTGEKKYPSVCLCLCVSVCLKLWHKIRCKNSDLLLLPKNFAIPGRVWLINTWS